MGRVVVVGGGEGAGVTCGDGGAAVGDVVGDSNSTILIVRFWTVSLSCSTPGVFGVFVV